MMMLIGWINYFLPWALFLLVIVVMFRTTPLVRRRLEIEKENNQILKEILHVLKQGK